MHRSAWLPALTTLNDLVPENAEDICRKHVWSSRCYLSLGQTENAAQSAKQALAVLPTGVHPLAQYAQSLLAKALVKIRGGWYSTQLLTLASQLAPHNPKFKIQLADQLTRTTGDWALSKRILSTAMEAPSVTVHRDWLRLRESLYQGACSPTELMLKIKCHASRWLDATKVDNPVQVSCIPEASGENRQRTGRQRIGLISPVFSASPVYFMCIGALRELTNEFDLVFFSRGYQQDWASTKFKSLACDWQEVASHSQANLVQSLQAARLDALIDMSGWMDTEVLAVLGKRPVKRQFKWVGGQFATTGLNTFNAFITDLHQSPPELSRLYTEPLAYMPHGYVSYTEPDYLPTLKVPSASPYQFRIGVVAHPIKLSVAFFSFLRGEIERYNQRRDTAVELVFVGARYELPVLQQRVARSLGLDENFQCGSVHVRFVPTQGHRAQLEAIRDLHWVIDTFPFTAGVTALECLALGVPLRTHAGAHFCARHGYSHAMYAGLTADDIGLQRLGVFEPGRLVNTGSSYLPSSCSRRDHSKLAESLAGLFHLD